MDVNELVIYEGRVVRKMSILEDLLEFVKGGLKVEVGSIEILYTLI